MTSKIHHLAKDSPELFGTLNIKNGVSEPDPQKVAAARQKYYIHIYSKQSQQQTNLKPNQEE